MTSTPQVYFSIDYRTLPSGMGQIIDTSQPKKIGDKWNMILVDYGDVDPSFLQEDSPYVKSVFFQSAQAAQEGWAGPVIKEIIQYLKEHGVTHVLDGEMAYEYPGADERGYFTLERWADIYLNPQW